MPVRPTVHQGVITIDTETVLRIHRWEATRDRGRLVIEVEAEDDTHILLELDFPDLRPLSHPSVAEWAAIFGDQIRAIEKRLTAIEGDERR